MEEFIFQQTDLFFIFKQRLPSPVLALQCKRYWYFKLVCRNRKRFREGPILELHYTTFEVERIFIY